MKAWERIGKIYFIMENCWLRKRYENDSIVSIFKVFCENKMYFLRGMILNFCVHWSFNFFILLKLRVIFSCNVIIFQTILSQELDKLRSEGEELKREKVIRFFMITSLADLLFILHIIGFYGLNFLKSGNTN